jgi:hypothetical protein
MVVDIAVQTPTRALQECPTSVGRRSRRELSSRSTTSVGSYKIRHIALIALMTLASIFIAAAPARAEAYPVCLAGGENNALQCEYATLGQCRVTASGGLGYCVMNPTYRSAYARYEGAAKRVH